MCIRDRALDAGYEPLALMCERKHISGSAAHIIKRCGDVPVYTGDRELLACLLYTSTGEEVGMEGKLKISFIGDSHIAYWPFEIGRAHV